MFSIKCCTLLVPVAAVLAALGLSAAIDGAAWDFLPGWRPHMMPDQTGKVAIVTGPTLGGIGYETAVELARKGARVVLAGRSRKKGEEALAALKKELPNAQAEFAELDLGSLAKVKDFCDEFLARDLPLHILVNNAGVMMNPFTLTVDGFESQFATNHLGHFLLTQLLLPVLERSAPSRVVSVSSAAGQFPDLFKTVGGYMPDWVPANATKEVDFNDFLGADGEAQYSRILAYGRSKLANILYARALARKMQGKKVYVNSCHPGGIKTNLAVHAKEKAKSDWGPEAERMLDSITTPLMLKPPQGAVTQLFLAAASEVETQDIRGQYYRPQAMAGSLPPSATVEAEENLWRVSERCTAKYL